MSPLTELRALHGRVVDSYALTPAQAGMLATALRDGPGQGTDIRQVALTLQHALDPALYVYAWYLVVERHPVLRTRLRWEGLAEPVQEVLEAVELPVTRVDWRGTRPEDVRARLLDLAARERAVGFDLAQAPLMRLFVARIGEAAWTVLWTVHQVLVDGPSLERVLGETFEAYECLRQRREVKLPPVRALRGFVELLAALDDAEAERHWRGLLEGLRAPTPLGIELSPSAATRKPPGGRFGARQRSLSAELGAALRERATSASISVHTLLLAAWALLLHRYGGGRDIVFGTMRSLRHRLPDDGRSAVGPYATTLPMRVAIDPAQAIDDWLATVRVQQLATRAHEHVPLARIAAWCGLAGSVPLFETLVVREPEPLADRLRGLGPAWEHRHVDHVGQTGHALTLVASGDATVLLRVEYDRSRFSDGVAERLLGHLQTVLEALAEDRCELVGELPLLTPAEREALVGPPPRAFAPGPALQQRFEDQVRRTPRAPALTVVADDGQRSELSYAQLNALANRLARRLRQAGAAPNRLVGLCAERSADVVVGLLAILKAGAAQVPLDPDHPKERSAFVLDDAGVRLMLVSPSLRAEWQGTDVALIDIDTQGPTAEVDERNLEGGSGPHDLACVLYASGPAGHPDGVQITHHNIARLFAATQHSLPFDERDVWTLGHSVALDISLWEVWGALLHGGRLVVVPSRICGDVAGLRDLLVAERVTVLNQTPGEFRRLAALACDGEVVPFSLRLVILGGEALDPRQLRPWFERYGDQRPRLVNMYGSTETTVHATLRPLSIGDLDEDVGCVIGEPIADLRLVLLDEQGGLVPAGVPGEIAVAGDGLGPGYLRRAQLTAQRFVPDPFDGRPGARMYLSGDLARWLDNGDLEYLGRRDRRLGIGGHRVEPGEIEALLARHPDVRRSAVRLREDAAGERRLVAYVVPGLLGRARALADEADLAARLRDHLHQVLPDAMLPSDIVVVDDLPTADGGAVDGRALPASTGRAGTVPAAGAAAARPAVARKQAAGAPLAAQPPVAEATSLAVAAAPAASGAGDASGVLTPAQRWFLDQRFEDAHHWNQAFCFELPAAAGLEQLRAAWRGLLARHAALRSRFRRTADGVWRIAGSGPDEQVPLVSFDLSALDDAQARERIEERSTEAQAGLSLERGPLARAVHFALGAQRPARLLVVIHQLAVDGVSWRILREDFEALLAAAMAGVAAVLPPPTASVEDWARALQRHAQSPALRAAAPAWAAIARHPAWSLPPPLPGAALAGPARHVMRLTSDETQRLLQRVPACHGTQAEAALLSALARALQARTGLAALRIDVEGHGREPLDDAPEVSRSVGAFASLFPLVMSLPEEPADEAPLAALRALQRQLDALPGGGLAYGVLRWMADDAALRESLVPAVGSPLLFRFLGAFDAVVAASSRLRAAPESTGPWRSPRAHRAHPLEIVADVRDGRLEIAGQHDGSTVDGAWVEGLLRGVHDALLELLSAAGQPAAGWPAGRPGGVASAPDAADAGPASATERPYPLTPAQRLCFVDEAARPGCGLLQWQLALDGPLNPTRMQRALLRVVERHPVLRSAFFVDAQGRTVQQPCDVEAVPWIDEDWRDVSAAEQARQLALRSAEDLARPLPLQRPPPMRVRLIRRAEAQWHLVWTGHRLAMDGGSWSIVMAEWSRAYEALASGRAPSEPPALPYAAYVDWLARGAAEAAAFWREQLADVGEPTRLAAADDGLAGDAASPLEPVRRADALPTPLVDALLALARRWRLAPATPFVGAWACVLAHAAEAERVVLGVSMSGRVPELAGIETLVGPCLTDVPLVLTLPGGTDLQTWLTQVQLQQFDVARHPYPLPEELAAGLPCAPGRPLFDSLLLVDDDRVDPDATRMGPAVASRVLAQPEPGGAALTLTVTLGTQPALRWVGRARGPTAPVLEVLADEMRLALQALAAGGLHDLDGWRACLPAATRGRARTARPGAPGADRAVAVEAAAAATDDGTAEDAALAHAALERARRLRDAQRRQRQAAELRRGSA